MKKIFTLFMATVVALSVMALPHKTLKVDTKVSKKDLPATVERKVSDTPLQQAAAKTTKTQKFQRDFTRTKQQAPATPSMKKVVAAQAADTVYYSFDSFQQGPEYYEEYGDWYIAVGDGTCGMRFDWYADDVEGTFTTEDMEYEYSYMWYLNDWDEEVYVEYVDITLTVEKVEVSSSVSQYVLHAVFLGDDGRVYDVRATHSILTPKDVVETTLSDVTFDFDGEMFTVNGQSDKMDFAISVYSDWPTGPYSLIDLDLFGTQITYDGVVQELQSTDILVKLAPNAEGVAGYDVYMEFINQDTVQHKVYAFSPFPPALDTVEIAINNLVIDESRAESYEWIFFTGTTEEWDIYAGVGDWALNEWTYEGDGDVIMMYITNQLTGDFTEGLYGKVDVKEDPKYGWMAEFEVYCVDNKLYKVTMKKEIPEPTDTVVINFNTSANAAYYPYLNHDLLLANNDENYYAGIDIVGVEMGGTFTMEEMDMDYSMLFSDYANRVSVEMADVQGTVFQVGDTTFIKAEIIGYDQVLYDVTLWHCVPTPTATVDCTVEAEFKNYMDKKGYYQLAGYNTDNTLYVALAPYTTEVEGTFINDGVFSRFGEGRYDFMSDGCVVYKNVNGEAVPYGVDKCTLTVTLVDGQIQATATLIAHDAVQYNVTMTAEYNNHLDYDATEGAVDRVYTTDDKVIIENYDGTIYYEVSAADMSDVFALYFFPEEVDGVSPIQPGTYTIDDTQDYFTVLASTGVTGNKVSPSFYGLYTEDGEGLQAPLYFLVGGTVEVSVVGDKMKVEVNAVNSYDVPVHIVSEYQLKGVDTGLPYDEKEGDVNVVYTKEDNVYYTLDFIPDWGELYVDMIAADGTHMTTLTFMVEAADDEINVPAGVYPIADTYEVGTVMSGMYDAEWGPLGSFYAEGGVSADGYFGVEKVWYMVAGTVTVENNDGYIKITAAATNSYGVPVNVTYNASPATAVENTKVENNNTRKVVKDNQLLIIKEGVEYNVLGKRL